MMDDIGEIENAENVMLSGVIGRISGLDSEGKGQAIVNEAYEKQSGFKIAVKRYSVDDASEEAIKLIRHEIVMMRQLRHDNVIHCLGSFALPNHMEIWLLTPFMSVGSLRTVLDNHFPDGIPESAISPIVRDVLFGLHHLHERGIVHRAIKSSHILIDDHGRAKLSGLRYSCSLYDTAVEASCSASVGGIRQDRYDYPLYLSLKNINWMSPEILQQNLLGYNEKSDIYSLGVTVCEIANGLVPFSDMPSTYMLLEKMAGSSPKLFDSTYIESIEESEALAAAAAQNDQNQADLVFSGQKPADSGVGASVGSCSNLPAKHRNKTYASRTFSDQFHDFVDQCCLKDAEERFSAHQLLSHPLIKQLKKASASQPRLTLISLLNSASRQDLMGDHGAFGQAASGTGTCHQGAGLGETEDTLTLALDTKMVIDPVEWDFE